MSRFWLVSIALLGVFALAEQAIGREWKSSGGKFTIEAEFVAVRNGKAVLEKPDGTFLSVPLEKLSAEDIEYIEAETGEDLDLGGDPDDTDEASDTADTPTRRRGPPVIKLKGEKSDDPPGEVRRFGDLNWGVKSMAFSPNGGLLAAGKMDRALLVFDVNESARKTFLEKLELLEQVTACAFTPDGTKLLAGGGSGLIVIWNVSKQGELKETGQFVGHVKDVNSIAISGDSKFALSAGEDKRLRYWQVDNGKEIAVYSQINQRIKACHLSADGRLGWATDGETLLGVDLKKEKTSLAKLNRSWASGQFAAFSPDSRWVAAGDQYNVRVWDLQSGKEQPMFEEDEIQWSGVFTPDGTRLITGGRGKISVWSMQSQKRIAVLATAGTYYVQCLAASPDNLHVAAIPGSAGQDIQVFRIPTE